MTADELGRLVDALLKPTALVEAALVLGCLLLAWLVVRLLRGPEPRPQAPWFGDHIIDGALFPLFALLLALLARWVVTEFFADRVPLAVFRLVIPVLVSLAAIRLTVRVLRRAFPGSQAMRVVERSVSWLAWMAVVLWITGLLPLMLAELDEIGWKVGGSRITVRNMLEGTVNAALVLVLALWLSSLLEARLLRGSGEALSMRKIAANVLRAALLLIGLVVALSAAGIDLTALGVLGGALGVGIGFGLQKLAANYVSGFVILAERSVRIGDMVKVDGFEGRISDITTRYTVIRSLGGREAIVPNEMMIVQRVENLSLADSLVALNTRVLLPFDADLDTLLPRLADAAAQVPRVLTTPAPGASLLGFADNGLQVEVGFWIADPHLGDGGVRSDVNLAVLRVLNAAGVRIPLPQRVVQTLPGA